MVSFEQCLLMGFRETVYLFRVPSKQFE